MSRKLLAIGLLATSMMAAPAFAAVNIAGSLVVDAYSGTNNGLTINIGNNNGVPAFLLSNTSTVNLFTISTPESAVNNDDYTHQPITVTFNFTDPSDASGNPITGNTSGDTSPLFILSGFFQNGEVVWDGPQTFTFGNGGAFSVALSDATFNEGAFWGLGNRGANITGTFTLLSDSTAAVPEPATWAMMIAGFGLVGASMRRRQKVSVTYA